MIQQISPYFYFILLLVHISPIYSVRTAIIPAAGFGTRFLPITKTVPKEMLPLVDGRPIMHEIIDEGVRSGLDNFVIITKKGKEDISDYFESSAELEQYLASKNRLCCVSSISSTLKRAHLEYVYQHEQRGLGDAINRAQSTVHENYFAVFLPDHIIVQEADVTRKLITILEAEGPDAVIAVEAVPDSELPHRGVMMIKEKLCDRVYEISGMVEKPSPENAPSHLAVAGRYLFSRALFTSLQAIRPDANGEVGLTEAINHMIENGLRVLIYEIEGKSCDTGRPLAWLEANIKYGLHHPIYKESVRVLLKEALN